MTHVLAGACCARWGALMASLLLAGCALTHAATTPPQPTSSEAWPRASAMAAEQAGAGRYAAADRGLGDFVIQYPGTREAAEATLHRAVYMADPANQSATARAATALLDSLLGTQLDSASRAEARVVRRITSALERGAALAASGSGSSSTSSADSNSPRPDDAKARDDEVQRLRSELAKANAELERIKKRVAQPKP